VTRINPLSYGIDGLRGALIGGNVFNLGLDLGVIAGLSLLALWFGAYLFSKIEA
jgi:ABC-2 type transport system permease protein